MKMPPGYRFVPTDNELIEHHLMNKINNKPNLTEEIREVEFYNNDPQTLAGDAEWYFFSSRDRKYANGNRPSRTAGNGYWKATGAVKKVYGKGGRLVGNKRTLDYYSGDGDREKSVKTIWGMHEFWVDHPPRQRTHANDMKLDDWVLCRIYKKASKVKGVCDQQQNINNGNGLVIEGEKEIESTSGGDGGDGGGRERGEEREEASTSSLSAGKRDDEQTSHNLDINTTMMQDFDDDLVTTLLQFESSIDIDFMNKLFD